MSNKNIIYIGDGSGDYCPSLKLLKLTQTIDNNDNNNNSDGNNRHFICCRKDWALHKKIEEFISSGTNESNTVSDATATNNTNNNKGSEGISGSTATGSCKYKDYIYEWSDGLELYNAIIHRIIGSEGDSTGSGGVNE